MTEVQVNMDTTGVEISSDLNVHIETTGESANVESDEPTNCINCENQNGEVEETSEVIDQGDSHRVSEKTRKSSLERLLEETLDTRESEDVSSQVFEDRKCSYSSCGSVGSADSDFNSGKSEGRRPSVYKQKNIESPAVSKGNIISERTENLFKSYERDMSVHEAKPMINVNEDIDIDQIKSDNDEPSKTKIDIAREEKEKELLEIKKQYQQRLLDDEKEQAKERAKKHEDKVSTGEAVDACPDASEDGDVFLERPPSSTASSTRVSVSSSASAESGEDSVPKRRTSVYEQKQIDAPTSTKGNVIASRTQNLFRQYSKDLLGQAGEEDDPSCTKNNDERKEELKNIKLQYQERLAQEEKEKAEERARRSSENEEVSRKSLGSHMNRYIALTKGEAVSRSSDEDEEDGVVDDSLYVDQHGVKIERSGGKVEIVKSSECISSIKNKFGGTAKWKKADNDAPPVDATTVNSARNVFKEGELRKAESPSLNRPVKKVRDPKQIMEMRKQVTYGNEEEPPQDNVIQKSVVEDIDSSSKHRALDVYKNLEKKQDTDIKLQKPKTKLMTDLEARATMEGIRSISSSASEASDVNETANDLTVDTVSGYGSAAPCSPSSTLSEDYLSDHKETSPRDELKDTSTNQCDDASELNMREDLQNHDDISPVHCQTEIIDVI